MRDGQPFLARAAHTTSLHTEMETDGLARVDNPRAEASCTRDTSRVASAIMSL